jgi:ABC-2 type transport system permease protein
MYSAMGLLIVVLGFVVFFYCLGALYDDRRDRSILFWKSLPISDTSTVLSKVVSATVLAPIVAVITGIIVGMLQLLILAVTLSFHGVNVWQMLVLAHPFRVMFNLVGYIPLYVLWALPSVGWLLLCSAWARNKPFLWAVALPVATGLLVSWFGIMGLFDLPTTWFWKNIVQRGLLSVFPGTGSVFGHNGNIAHSVAGNPGMDFMDLSSTYQLLASPNLWIGVVVGLGLLAGAVWFRRWRDDS